MNTSGPGAMTELTLVSGEPLKLPESPRWRDERLWFSDVIGGRVCTIDDVGRISTVCVVDARPSGLGWRPAGEMLVVSQLDHSLCEVRDGLAVPVADLSGALKRFGDDVILNDMVVSGAGVAYMGTVSLAGTSPTPLLSVAQDGAVTVENADLKFPNGLAITPDGSRLIVAEYKAARLTAFEIGRDGRLGGEHEFASLDSDPDGICLDASGAVWAACPHAGKLLRVREGGEVLRQVVTPGMMPLAPMLGVHDGSTLYVAIVSRIDPSGKTSPGHIALMHVDTPGAGLP
jgi:sugar lactone lactonase YvrE